MMSASIKVWDIPGGIHPEENKAQSVKTPIKSAPMPAELTFPLSQHIGAPAESIVAVGDKVLKGQIIAKANGFVSVPIHASTSGEVIAIEDRLIPHSSGMSAPCIVIKSDGKDEWIKLNPTTDYKQLDKAALIDIIRNAGIAGMGGAGFPSAVKLNTKPTQIIETLILNGTECEPYITADDMLMRERAEQIIQGALILQHIVKPTQQTLIGVEDNKPEGIAALKKAAEGTNVQIVVFPTKYPSGGEKQLIQILTGKEVPVGKLPGDIGIVCQNVGSCVAIYRAIVHGEPLISRITTVTGYAVKQQQNYEVLLGTPIRKLLDDCQYDESQVSRLIMGGPMMGFALTSQDVPIVKTTNCILAPTKEELPPPPPAQACIRCAMCSEACPVSLLPQQMYWFAQSKNQEALKAHHLFDCIECGACSYACPSNIPLVQYYRASKAEIRKTEADLKKSEYSKERYEARQARLDRIEAEKEAKRKERQSKAAESKPNVDAQAAIDAAVARTAAKTAPIAAAINTDDPVQAAIERAKAKAAGNEIPVDPVADAQAKISALETRLKKAEDKLATARANNDANLDAFIGSVEKLQQKITEAKANAPTAEPAPTATSSTSPINDPVQAAIERAKAKRSGNDGNTDPKEKLSSDIASLEKRIASTQAKLSIAEAEGASTIDVLKTSIEKLQTKLDSAKQQLSELG
jgi:electron transport complex protein RnfC